MRKHLRLLGFSGQIMFFINIAVVGITFEDQKCWNSGISRKPCFLLKWGVLGLQGRLYATCGTSRGEVETC
jgi:hypothetical protein